MDPQIRLFGGQSLSAWDGRHVALPTRKCWGLLAYLVQSKSRDIPREEIAALLWPRSAEAQARASLRQELAVLRRALETAGHRRIAYAFCSSRRGRTLCNWKKC